MTQSALLALPAALILTVSSAFAADGYAIELGHGDDSTGLARLHAKWKWDRKWFEAGDWHLAGYWEATLGRWNGDGTGAKDLWEAAVTPVFRLQPTGGINFHLVRFTYDY